MALFCKAFWNFEDLSPSELGFALTLKAFLPLNLVYLNFEDLSPSKLDFSFKLGFSLTLKTFLPLNLVLP